MDTSDPAYRYYQRKYIDFYNVSSPVFSTKNVDIIRLADIYLMYAEVMLKLNSADVATEYVNKVRRRAWGESNYDVPGN